MAEQTKSGMIRETIDKVKAAVKVAMPSEKFSLEHTVEILREMLAQALADENREAATWKDGANELRQVERLLTIYDTTRLKSKPGEPLGDMCVTVWSVRNWIKWTRHLQTCHAGQALAIESLSSELKTSNEQIAELSVKVCQKDAELILLKRELEKKPVLTIKNHNWEVE